MDCFSFAEYLNIGATSSSEMDICIADNLALKDKKTLDRNSYRTGLVGLGDTPAHQSLVK